MNTHLLEQAQKLPLEEQLELVEALWDGIAQYGVTSLTQKRKDELDCRLADLEANPDDVVPWSEVKASAMSRVG